MTWSDQQWSFDLLYGLDRFAAAIFFHQTGMSISAMCWLVRQGKGEQLKLRSWQIAFLNWLEPKLSQVHCEWAAKDDYARLQASIKLLS